MERCLRCVKCACSCNGVPEQQWCWATVIGVGAGVAYTTRGTYSLGLGHNPRPGEQMKVPCAGTGFAVGETVQHQGKKLPRRRPELPPLMPASYDTPQRPGAWGSGRVNT